MTVGYSFARTGGMKPVSNSRGLVTGYAGQPSGPVGSQAPVSDSSGLITGYNNGSGYDVRGGNFGGGGYAATGVFGTGGVKSPSAPGPGNANDSFSLLSTVKNPAIASANADLLSLVKSGQDNINKTYADYLNEAHAQNAQNKADLARDREWLDPSRLEGQLSGIQKSYADTQRGIDQEYQRANQSYADTQGKSLQALQDENKTYEAAAQGVADRALQYAQRRNNLYQAGSGTPGSDSGDMRQRAIQAFIDINTPLQQQLSQRRSDIITNVAMPLNRELRGNTVNELTGFRSPMEASISQMQSGDAKLIANMRAQLAGRSLQESIQYMQSLGLPIQMQQAVINGAVDSLGRIQNIDAANTFYGLSAPYENPFANGVTSYSNTGYPTTGFRTPSYAGSGMPVPTASPVSVSPATGGSLPKTVNPIAPNVNQYDPAARLMYYQNSGIYPEQDPNYSPDLYSTSYAESRVPRANLGPITGTGYAATGGTVIPAGTPSVDIPLDYAWGRSPRQQNDFLTTASLYQ